MDIGGTSCDIAFIESGEPLEQAESVIDGRIEVRLSNLCFGCSIISRAAEYSTEPMSTTKESHAWQATYPNSIPNSYQT
jgi:hypothetical protein